MDIDKTLKIKTAGKNKRAGFLAPGGGGGGFTLVEMVISILLTGIMAIGIYNIIISGIQNYNTNQKFLDTSNSIGRAMTVIRRDMSNAVTPPTGGGYSPNGSGAACPYDPVVDVPDNGSGVNNPPVVIFSNGQSPSICRGANNCNEAAFFESIPQSSPAQYLLIIYCLGASNNALYKEEVKQNGTANSYPVAYNISSIYF